jgi:formylglycine-generating enzyme required for sulfatase activity
MSGQIFISYRREESRWSARSLHDRLAQRFDRNQIFMDVDSVSLGEDFVKTIEETVGSCDVLIAVIGAHWLTSTDEQGGRRLDNLEDFVRMEIATALRRDIRVIPVLVDGASMPRSTDLPDDLKQLVRRNALQVGDTHFDDDCRRLVAAIEQVLEKAAAERRERKSKERLEQEPQAQPHGPDAPSTPPAKPEADNEIPKVVYPLAPKPAGPECEKPPPPSSGRTEGKRPSKQVIAFLAMAAVVVVGGLIYLAIRPSQSPQPQPAPPSASPSKAVIATPTPAPTSSLPVGLALPSPSISLTPSRQEPSRTALQTATKDHPWVNSLGMKFVPVAGTQVLFSVWDTRVQDFETFVKSTGYDATGGMYSLGKDGDKQRGATWKEPGFSQGPNHPVMGVSWNDAEEFCQWLTKRERSAGGLPQDRGYRLPKDEEWSVAVGLKNEVGTTPEEKSRKINLYPWDIPLRRDKSWPPPARAGNYAGEEVKNGDWPIDWLVIEGYNDGYPRTSPVGSFPANQFGLHDMGGNVWQWCKDWYNAQMKHHVLRGASWLNGRPVDLLASYRNSGPPDNRRDAFGFRCVVAVESSR